jgi:hypothetical protein
MFGLPVELDECVVNRLSTIGTKKIDGLSVGRHEKLKPDKVPHA